MPQWKNKKTLKSIEKDEFEIFIIPRPYWRRIFKWFPYFVGDIVEFEIKTTVKKQRSEKIPPYYVFEIFRDKQKEHWAVDNLLWDFPGRNIIDGEGDVVYSIGKLPSQGEDVFFTAKVINKDGIFFQTIFFIGGAVVTLLAVFLAWILGYIQIIW